MCSSFVLTYLRTLVARASISFHTPTVGTPRASGGSGAHSSGQREREGRAAELTTFIYIKNGRNSAARVVWSIWRTVSYLNIKKKIVKQRNAHSISGALGVVVTVVAVVVVIVVIRSGTQG